MKIPQAQVRIAAALLLYVSRPRNRAGQGEAKPAPVLLPAEVRAAIAVSTEENPSTSGGHESNPDGETTKKPEPTAEEIRQKQIQMERRRAEQAVRHERTLNEMLQLPKRLASSSRLKLLRREREIAAFGKELLFPPVVVKAAKAALNASALTRLIEKTLKHISAADRDVDFLNALPKLVAIFRFAKRDIPDPAKVVIKHAVPHQRELFAQFEMRNKL